MEGLEGLEIIPIVASLIALLCMAYMNLKLPLMRLIVRILEKTILRDKK